jgi:hypothetical protein
MLEFIKSVTTAAKEQDGALSGSTTLTRKNEAVSFVGKPRAFPKIPEEFCANQSKFVEQ